MRWLVLAALAACSSSSRIGAARFANEPPVWRVDDRKDVPKQPAKQEFYRYTYHFNTFYERTVRGLRLERHRRALGVNSLDEVPDSTWFTNRIGKREMTPDEIRRGPAPSSPEAHMPWTITKLKTGGTQVGFLVKDARDVTFLLKFDRHDLPEVETGADAIVARLLWAAGYNTPADHVVYFRREDLQIAPDAKGVDQATVDKALANVAIEDGKIRGIASVFIAGKILGGTPRLGVRRDDPNDLIPHELRRDQRGQAALFAWLAHTDTKQDNTIDTWQEDPVDPKVHYVVHYLLDFGNALGADIAITNHLYLGHQYEIDPKAVLSSIAGFGLVPRPWEDRKPTGIRGLGIFTVHDYNPGTWKPNTAAQLPLIWADRFDQFWGAKIAIRFTREQIAAAVDAARFSDPRATKYMTEMLIARQRKTARYWFARVNPIDNFTIIDGKLCFTDLAVRHRLTRRATRFAIEAYDPDNHRLGKLAVEPDRLGRACTALPLARRSDRYTILRIENSRGMPGTLVHVAEASGELRVIGLHRL